MITDLTKAYASLCCLQKYFQRMRVLITAGNICQQDKKSSPLSIILSLQTDFFQTAYYGTFLKDQI